MAKLSKTKSSPKPGKINEGRIVNVKVKPPKPKRK